jgi:predicted DNA-binding transcriptional regulator YafY
MIDSLHEAIAAHRVLRVDYLDGEQRSSVREVEPLCLAFWGRAWTLGAWCRLRTDFRNFRPDRIATFEPTGEIFAETPERGLDAYLGRVGSESDGIF